MTSSPTLSPRMAAMTPAVINPPALGPSTSPLTSNVNS